MSKHDIRARVLSAISRFETFTVAELQEAAGLKDRHQADFQISRFVRDGFLEKETLPPSGTRGIKLYRVTRDPDKRKELADETSLFLPKPRPSVSFSDAAMELARAALEKAEADTQALEQSEGFQVKQKLPSLRQTLDDAKTNLGTALLELGDEVSEEQTPLHPVIVASLRWRRLNAAYLQLETKVQEEGQRSLVGRYAVQVARAVASNSGAEPSRAIVRGALQDLPNAAITETILDEFDFGSLDDKLGSLVSYTCRARNPAALGAVFWELRGVDRTWWNYNRQCFNYLTGTDNSLEWIKSLGELFGQMNNQMKRSRDPAPSPKLGVLGMYSCDPGDLTERGYLYLTKNMHLSVVSPRAIDYLGLSEPIEPTFMPGAHLCNAVDVSFLKPQSRLHVYGFLSRNLRHWAGPPEFRLAACLLEWGLPLVVQTLARVAQLASSHVFLIAHAAGTQDPAVLTKQIKEELHAEEVATIRLAP